MQYSLKPYINEKDFKNRTNDCSVKRDDASRNSYGTAAKVWGGNYVKTPSEIGNGDQIENLRYWTSWDFQTINGLPLYINGTDEWKKDGTWFKLAECVYMLPSGINTVSGWPASTLSADDQLFIQNGLNYEFDPAMADKSFRYIRLDIKESSQGRAQFMMAEIEFLGVLDNN